MRAPKVFRGGIPNHKGGTAALRRFDRGQRIAAGDRPKFLPEAINAGLIGKGKRLPPTKGFRRDRRYKAGARLEPLSYMEMVAVFWDTIGRAQKGASHVG